MTQSFIQPKGSLNTKVDTSNLQNQLAQMFANQQLQNQANNQPDEVRQSLNDLIKSKLMPVEVPQQVTIKDLIKAGNTPEGMKLLGDYIADQGANSIQGNLYWNPQTKQMESAGERVANERAEILKQRQAQALQQLKEQNDIATALNHTYMQQDIANEQNKLRRELAEQEMQFKREQMEEAKREKALDRAQQMQMLNMRLNSMGGGTATGGAAGLTPKQTQKNNEALNGLNAVQSQMDRFSNSFDKVRPTKAGALLAGAVASKGFGNEAESNFNAQKTLLFNKIARELGGEKGVLSDQDIKRIEASLPSLSDSLPQKKAKMQAIYDLLEDRKSQYRTGVSSDNDPMGLGL